MALTLPLTTTFTAPASCSTKTTSFSLFLLDGASPTRPLLEQARQDAPAECYPPSYAASATYSPGLCPSGYEIASETGGSGGTTAYCCPQGGYSLSVLRSCASSYSTSRTALIKSQQPPTGAITAYTSVVGPGVALIDSIVIVYSGEYSGGSLSVGAKVGIGVGCALAAILFGIAIFLLIRRRRKAGTQNTESAPVVEGKHELDGNVGDVRQAQELGEKDGDVRQAQELDVQRSQPTAELEERTGPAHDHASPVGVTELESPSQHRAVELDAGHGKSQADVAELDAQQARHAGNAGASEPGPSQLKDQDTRNTAAEMPGESRHESHALAQPATALETDAAYEAELKLLEEEEEKLRAKKAELLARGSHRPSKE